MSNADPTKFRKATALNDDLDALSNGKVRSWGQISHLLDQIEQQGTWQTEAKSFTEWMRNKAQAFDLKQAAFWRYLTAGRYYVQLRETLAAYNVSCPPLEALPDKVSPENLELLSKLARVIPDEGLRRLAGQVIDGSVTRAKLRTTWQAYRPALGGRTAQGGGVGAPRINLNDHIQTESLAMASVLATLTSAGPGWTGGEKPDLYEIFMELRPEYIAPRSGSVVFDAVAVLREHKNSPLEIHGIEISSRSSPNMKEKFEGMAPFCSFLWLAIPGGAHDIAKSDIPRFVGVLRVEGNAVVVDRPAGPADLLGTELFAMTKGLLLRTLKR